MNLADVAAAPWPKRVRFVAVVLVLSAAGGLGLVALFGFLVREFGGRVPAVAWATAGMALGLLVLGAVVAAFVWAILHALGRDTWLPFAATAAAVVLMIVGFVASTPPGTESKMSSLLFSDGVNADFATAAEASAADDALAGRFRPLLFLDSREVLRPLDVDAFLAERDARGRPVVHACTRVGQKPDPCSAVTRSSDLYPFITSPDRSYLDLGEQGWERHDRVGTPQRLYYHLVRDDATHVFLEYWWFFRYNVSPVHAHAMCLAGLSLADVTCFDHEGDWEGVTVRVDTRRRKIASVTYSGHHWPGYRYDLSTLERFGAVSGTHAKVFVAYGSHASYPTRCTHSCDQLDFRADALWLKIRVADGDHDGARPWQGNEDAGCHRDHCVLPLPVAPSGRGALWDAFDGNWGRAGCAPVPVFCVRNDGPPSPSYQKRFASPGGGSRGSVAELVRQARRSGDLRSAAAR